MADAALTAGGRVGRYFSIVTMVPTLFLVLWTYLLVKSDAWRAEPNLAALGVRLADWSIPQAAWLLLSTFVLALFLHPLQFATVQLLEGYWGTSAVALGAMRLGVARHRGRAQRIRDRLDALDKTIEESFTGHRTYSDDLDDDVLEEKRDRFLDERDANHVIPLVIARDALRHRAERFPDGRRILPTRLGNTLRRYEDRAGSQYGLDAMTTAPHFLLVVPEAHVAYVRDTRQLLDTTVRLCFVSLLATVLTVAALATDGWWLLIALVPYGLAYLAYRAAIAAADEYGTAVATVIDVDRFTLYERLGLRRPRDTHEERETNAQLMSLLHWEHIEALHYTPAADEKPPPRGLYRLTRRLRPSVDAPLRQRRSR
ncbi:hypothetical protein BU204_24350 [Actinophytocola xanthii]|uniref:Uncharacterized protein n=2 Tax=Actinophytocola xanthii TaxID=1912961 RepID=A0A1Q8CKI5_9PSEU|nr:hypothetical protein BU204_24350 [Actinophytocola xanthii]